MKLISYVCELLYQNLQIYHLPSDSDLLFFQKHPLQFDENDDVRCERIVLFVYETCLSGTLDIETWMVSARGVTVCTRLCDTFISIACSAVKLKVVDYKARLSEIRDMNAAPPRRRW